MARNQQASKYTDTFARGERMTGEAGWFCQGQAHKIAYKYQKLMTS